MTDPNGNMATYRLMNAYWPDRASSKRIAPWTWSALTEADRGALLDLVNRWVHDYNEVYATGEQDLIPPCWPHHPWLASELPVQAFLWWSAHRDPTCPIEHAAEYYNRHLPAFKARIPAMLGRSPVECHRGQHPTTWRREMINTVNNWDVPSSADYNGALAATDFGFL